MLVIEEEGMVVQPRLPDGLSESSFEKALRAFEKIVGDVG
jgi:hypothetical protein